MSIKRCLACAEPFKADARVPNQSYCARQQCQRERKRLWQARKRREDVDYQLAQKQSQKRWQERHPEYWKQYRESHPSYTDANRLQQSLRGQSRPQKGLAKMDSTRSLVLDSGLYVLQPARTDLPAKMDAYLVQITVLARA